MVGILLSLDDALVMLEREDGAFVQIVLRSAMTVAINVGEGRHKTMQQLRGKRLSRGEIVAVLDAFQREDPSWRSILSGARDSASLTGPDESQGLRVLWIAAGLALCVILVIAWSLGTGP